MELTDVLPLGHNGESGTPVDIPPCKSLKFLLPRSSGSTLSSAPDPLTQFIEDTSIQIVTIQGLQSANTPGYAYLHTDHTSVLDNNGLAALRNLELNGRDAFIRMRADLTMCNPNVHLEVSNVSSTVDELHGVATVYLSGRLSRFRLADTKPRETVTILEWKRFSGYGWTCTHSRFLHGFADVPVSLDYGGDHDNDRS